VSYEHCNPPTRGFRHFAIEVYFIGLNSTEGQPVAACNGNWLTAILPGNSTFKRVASAFTLTKFVYAEADFIYLL